MITINHIAFFYLSRSILNITNETKMDFTNYLNIFDIFKKTGSHFFTVDSRLK